MNSMYTLNTVYVQWDLSKVETIRTTTASLEYGVTCNLGDSSTLSVGMVMRIHTVEHNEATFLDLSVAVQLRERLAQ